jgi:hypothetical protein
MSHSRGGGKLLLGFVVVHVLCCGLPLLIAAGVVTSAGGLLRNPVVLAVGVGLLIAAVAPALRRARAARGAECCAPPGAPTSSADDPPLGPGR